MEELQQEHRFLDIWLKYAAISAQPLDVFNFMYKQGICTMQADMYVAWAWQLELSASYKTADKIFGNGIKTVTDQEVKARLQAKQKEFQARVMRRMKGEEIGESETEEEQRSALGQLKGHGRHNKVGSVRVGSAKVSGPGTVQIGGRQPLSTNNGQNCRVFSIFRDENAVGGGGMDGAQGGEMNLPSAEDRKENELKAGSWGKSKTSRAANVPLSDDLNNNVHLIKKFIAKINKQNK